MLLQEGWPVGRGAHLEVTMPLLSPPVEFLYTGLMNFEKLRPLFSEVGLALRVPETATPYFAFPSDYCHQACLFKRRKAIL